MENAVEDKPGKVPAFSEVVLPEDIRQQLEAERKISSNVMSIRLTGDGIVIRDDPQTDTTGHSEELGRLSGVYCQGVQYYDLKDVKYINNTGMAILIDLLKNLLEMGVEVQFVNVDEKIKSKIKALGLEKIIKYGDNG
jgi:ABC-type transporter Mla MlaB component